MTTIRNLALPLAVLITFATPSVGRAEASLESVREELALRQGESKEALEDYKSIQKKLNAATNETTRISLESDLIEAANRYVQANYLEKETEKQLRYYMGEEKEGSSPEATNLRAKTFAENSSKKSIEAEKEFDRRVKGLESLRASMQSSPTLGSDYCNKYKEARNYLANAADLAREAVSISREGRDSNESLINRARELEDKLRSNDSEFRQNLARANIDSSQCSSEKNMPIARNGTTEDSRQKNVAYSSGGLTSPASYVVPNGRSVH